MGLMALTGPAEIFFSATFSLPRKSSPIPPSSSTVNSKLGQAPGTSFEPYPVPADPKKIVQALDTLRDLKSLVSAKAVNTTTGPQLPKYIFIVVMPL